LLCIACGASSASWIIESILQEIRRTAQTNNGKPLGVRRFERETGIKLSHWQKHWAHFADAQREAGFKPNEKIAGYGKQEVLAKLAGLARAIGRIPALSDMAVARARDASFPSPDAIMSNLGTKADRIRHLLEYCQTEGTFEDVIQLCCSGPIEKSAEKRIAKDQATDGFVYLMKSGRNYKIGKSNSVGRREREIALQLPERVRVIHEIRTDDPAGIEAYWHKRFESKRKNGEWFDLNVEDVSAFRRRLHLRPERFFDTQRHLGR